MVCSFIQLFIMLIPALKHFHFVALWITIAYCMSGCKTTISKERAKDYVNDYIEYRNTQVVGGSTMKNAQIEIKEVRYINDSSVIIDYTWSGILKAPPLAVPQPDETISNEPGTLKLHLKNEQWVFE